MNSEYFCHKSSGKIFGIEKWWMFLACDEGIVDFYHWLAIRNGIEVVKGSMRGAHISFVKGEKPINLDYWETIRGQEVEFYYSNVIRYDNDFHVWIDVELDPFNKIRNDLGLPDYKSFHITLGRLKYFI